MKKPTKITDLVPDPENARKRTDRSKPLLEKSLQEFGAARSVVIDKDGIVRAGNGTIEAATAAGITKVKVIKGKPDELVVVQRDDLEGEKAKAYAIADNRTGELAEWDTDILQDTLDSFGQFTAEDVGFSPMELEELIPSEQPEVEDVEPQIDRAAELQKEWGTEEGQLWIIEGQQTHRLLCGDATKAEDVEWLMGGATVDLVFTSPPYAQQREYDKKSTVDVSDWDSLMRGVFGNLPVNHKTQVLVNLGLIHRDCEWVPYWEHWIEWMREQGWRRFGWYVWDQGAGLPGDWNGRLAPSFEFVFHFNRESVRPSKVVDCDPDNISIGDRATAKRAKGGSVTSMRAKNGQVKEVSSTTRNATKIPDSVIRLSRCATIDMARNHHPATYPVGLVELALKAWPGGVYDPCFGSGTTMLAAEQLNRRCYGLEISPAYCAVILQRMTDAGLTCTLQDQMAGAK